MEIVEINTKKVCELLNEIMEYELAGVVRYTHSSMMVTGPHRLPIVALLKALYINLMHELHALDFLLRCP